jgi:predicted nucleic acid-binding Zn ribbon protein
VSEQDLPRRVGEGLDAIARRLGAPTASSMGAVFSRWDEAVGPAIASHARPIALADGVLTVGVDEPGWATQLRYLANDVVARIAAVVGAGVVGRIELRVEAPREARNGPRNDPR